MALLDVIDFGLNLNYTFYVIFWPMEKLGIVLSC